MPKRGQELRGARVVSFVVVTLLVVILDQATKAAARAALSDGRVLTLIPGVMDLKLVYNTGAAFSLGEGAGALFVVFALAVLVVGFWLVWTRDDISMPLSITIACICGGGVGNMIDRVLFGSVTDFLATTFMDFPVFNVADIFVTCGVIVMLILVFVEDRSDAGQAEKGGSSH